MMQVETDSIRKGCDDGPPSYDAYSGVDGRQIVTFTHVGMQQSGNGRTLSGMAFWLLNVPTWHAIISSRPSWTRRGLTARITVPTVSGCGVTAALILLGAEKHQ